MTYTPSSSRNINVNPQTPAALRATLAELAKSLLTDQTGISYLSDLIDQLRLATNLDAVADEAINEGNVLRLSSGGHVEKADASALATSDVCGIATSTVNSGGTVSYALSGVVTIDGWGLTAGSLYYLSAATAGAIVTAPDDTTEGTVSLVVGFAMSTSEMLVLRLQPTVH